MDITELLANLLNAAQNGPFTIFLIMVAVIAIAFAMRDREIALLIFGLTLMLFGFVLPTTYIRDHLIQWFPDALDTVSKVLNIVQNPQLDNSLIITGIIALLRALHHNEGMLIICGIALIVSGISLSIQSGASKTFLTLLEMKGTPNFFKLIDLAHSAPLGTFFVVAGFTSIIWALRNRKATLITAAIVLIIVTGFGVLHS